MKYIFLLLLLATSTLFSQSGGITYQAVIYNPQGEQLPGVDNPYAPLINTEVCLRFNIIDHNGTIEYQEQVQATTDMFGMVNLLIGNAQQTLGYAAGFSGIVWDSNPKFLKVELDIQGGCMNFEELSNQPFTYVPFAYHSDNAGEPGPQGDDGQSAYDVWLDLGNRGTEQDFIDSLTGPDGAPGLEGISAYQVWLDLGNTGTEQDFIDSLMGPKGDNGFLDSGTAIGNTTYWDGSQWVLNSNHLYNDGTNVIIGTDVVEPSSALTIESTNKGVLIPRLSLSQRDAISAPATGLLVFQTDDASGFYYFDGTQWIQLISSNNTGNTGTGNSSQTLIYTVDGF